MIFGSLVLSLQLKNRYPRGFSAYPAASQPAVFALSSYPVYLVKSSCPPNGQRITAC